MLLLEYHLASLILVGLEHVHHLVDDFLGDNSSKEWNSHEGLDQKLFLRIVVAELVHDQIVFEVRKRIY